MQRCFHFVTATHIHPAVLHIPFSTSCFLHCVLPVACIPAVCPLFLSPLSLPVLNLRPISLSLIHSLISPLPCSLVSSPFCAYVSPLHTPLPLSLIASLLLCLSIVPNSPSPVLLLPPLPLSPSPTSPLSSPQGLSVSQFCHWPILSLLRLREPLPHLARGPPRPLLRHPHAARHPHRPHLPR